MRSDNEFYVVGNHEIHFDPAHGSLIKSSDAEHDVAALPPPAPEMIDANFEGAVLGRTDQILTATTAIELGEAVELHGPSGAGKSTLLEFLRHDYPTSQFHDGAIYRRAIGWSAADIVRWLYGHFFTTQLGFLPADTEQRQSLHDKRALILLDDVNMTSEELEWLMNVLPHCVVVIATSKPVLQGSSCSIELQGLPLDAAVTLLQQKLGHPGFHPEERSAAERLCRVLECLPLRIVQVASLMREQSLTVQEASTAIGGLDEFEGLMAEGLKALSESHRQLLGVLASLGEASVTEAQLFAITKLPKARKALIDLARRGLAEEGVEQVLLRYRKLLKGLRRRGLVEKTEGRYRLRSDRVDAIREAVSPEWQVKLILYHLALAEKNRKAPAALLENCEEMLWAVDYVSSVRQWVDALSLAQQLVPALAFAGRWDAWGHVLQLAQAAAEKLKDARAVAWTLHEQGVRAFVMGSQHTAKELLTKALRMREEQGDTAGVQATLHNLDLALEA